MQPQAYVFDAYGTLFDVHSAAARHAERIGERWEALSETWRTKQLEYTWVRALAGRQVSFWRATEDALDYAAEKAGGLEKGLRDDLLEAYRDLDAYPECADVLAGLRERGAKVAILSNGDPDMLERAVKSSGLSGAFDAVLSVQEAGIFKPAARVYRLAVDSLGVEADRISFQSSNRWDIAGASAFGFRCVWVNRVDRPDEYLDMPAHQTLRDLRGLLE